MYIIYHLPELYIHYYYYHCDYYYYYQTILGPLRTTITDTKPTDNKSFIQEACRCSLYRASTTTQKLIKK